jgi:hypothetical protein
MTFFTGCRQRVLRGLELAKHINGIVPESRATLP